MTYQELQQFEYLNGVQAAIYCNMSARSFYYHVAAGRVAKHLRAGKIYYKRRELDENLNPHTTIEKARYIQEQNKFLTAKRNSALRVR